MPSTKGNFKVVAVSSTRNSFGLRGMVIVSGDGEGWEVGANDLNVRERGDVVRVPIDGNGEPLFARMGWEIPRRLCGA